MSSKKNDSNIEKLLNFVEELAWLLDNYKGLRLESTARQLRNTLESSKINDKSSNLSRNQNIRSLVGIFPELFQNKVFFPTNQSIIEFANEILQMNINPSKNRSKTEIIGEIVCTTYSLTETEIEKVVKVLNKMVDNEVIAEKVKNMKRENTFSWNEVIQKLAE